jgi:hypothetical protein
MAAPKPSAASAATRTPTEPPLAALETLFGPPGAALSVAAQSDHAKEPDAQNGGRQQRPREANETPSPEAQSDPSASSVWQAVRRDDPAQRGAARVTVTVSVTAAERRKLKQMALDRDTTIQKLLEPAVLAVLRSAERR